MLDFLTPETSLAVDPVLTAMGCACSSHVGSHHGVPFHVIIK